MKSGYDCAIAAALKKLETLDKAEVCARTGAEWDGAEFKVPWFGELRGVSSGVPAERVLWLHYLTLDYALVPTGKLIAYRDIPSARFYEPVFFNRAVRPLIKRFGGAPQEMTAAGLKIGGVKAEYGTCAVTLCALPFTPVTYVLWEGDGELPPDGAALFDGGLAGRLPAEDLTVLAAMGAYKLIAAAAKSI